MKNSLVNALMSNQENLATVKQFLKDEGASLGGQQYQPKRLPNPSTLKSKLESASEEELQVLVDTLGITVEAQESTATVVASNPSNGLATVPASELEDEVRGTVTTKDGKEVECIMGAFIGRAESGNYHFKLKNGHIVTINPDVDASDAINNGEFEEEEFTFPINPNTLRYGRKKGYLYGNPNYSHEVFASYKAERLANKDKMSKYRNSLEKLGLSKAQIDQKVMENVDTVVSFPFGK